MAKYLLLIVVLVAVYLIWKGANRAKPANSEQRSASIEKIVQCAQCGLYFPRHEAVEADGELFCSEEHRRAPRSGRTGTKRDDR
ncbi:MAG: hypothetical protein EXR39_03890 [Betaproteobacteria bacterium]|nr:hypothetical protein [Betaproteobacteria bacterium]